MFCATCYAASHDSGALQEHTWKPLLKLCALCGDKPVKVQVCAAAVRSAGSPTVSANATRAAATTNIVLGISQHGWWTAPSA